MSQAPPGTEQNPLRVAVVGSGPSGFYAAEALLKSDHTVAVDVFDRLPSPFGLVRSGVAPDHPKLKKAIKTYEKVAQHEGFRFIGNVTIGHDIGVEDLREAYHAVVFTCGAESDRRLGIPGEDLRGSHTATEFVGWYNAHPDYRGRSFDLDTDTAVIIGQGNVAADVARILCKTVDELRHTDIAEHALEVLARSRIETVHVIGRRGPVQAKFTSKELKEFAALADCAPWVDPAELELDDEDRAELEDKNNAGAQRNMELFRQFAAAERGAMHRLCRFEFLESPQVIEGEQRVRALVLERNRLEGPAFSRKAVGTGETTRIECGLVFRSIGYRGVPIEGLPFDERRGVLPNEGGRIVDASGAPLPGLYTAGWIKRGPTGIIGTNRADAVETVEKLLEDADAMPRDARPGTGAILALLEQRGVRAVSFEDWQCIDAAEIGRGEPKGKPREKFTRVGEMLELLD